MSMNFSAPRSAPKPASVTTTSASFSPSRVAITELQPCAMLANGPPCTNAGEPSSVCTRLGASASFSSTAIAPSAFRSFAVTAVPSRFCATIMRPSRSCRSSRLLRQAEHRHHLGGDRDVESVLAREAVGDAAQAADDGAQRAVVHVEAAPPRHPPRVDAQRIAPVDVVVDHRGQQVVGRGDGVEVAGEVQVDLVHRHHLRIAAAGRAALHAERWPQRWLAQADHRARADPVQRVAETDGGGGLALARRGRADAGDQHQRAIRPALQRVDEADPILAL